MYKISDVFEPIGKKVLYVHEFKPKMTHDQGGSTVQDFSAYYEANSWLKELGYLTGSMERHHPIGFAPLKDCDYISKWTNMDSSDRKQLHGVMLSDSFRNGSVLVVFCESPLKSLIAKIPFKKIPK